MNMRTYPVDILNTGYRYSTLFTRGQQRCGLWLPKKAKGSSYSITERRVPELIPVLGSQPAGDMSHKPQKGPGSNRSRDAIG